MEVPVQAEEADPVAFTPGARSSQRVTLHDFYVLPEHSSGGGACVQWGNGATPPPPTDLI